MRVYVRIRPCKKGEDAVAKKTGFKTVEYYDKALETSKAFEASMVYDPLATQDDVFGHVQVSGSFWYE